MRNLTKVVLAGILAVGLFSGFPAGSAFAEEGTASEWDATFKNLGHQEKVAYFKKLKAENPEEFQELMKERKAKIKERMAELKEKDPEKFEQFKRKLIHKRRERLEKLRTEDPERFREVMQNKIAKLKELKEQNPERYNQILKKHPHLEERFQKYANHPHGYPPGFDRRNPRAADRMEDHFDRRENIRDARYQGGRRDRLEDKRDRREDRRDRREDYWDEWEDKRD